MPASRRRPPPPLRLLSAPAGAVALGAAGVLAAGVALAPPASAAGAVPVWGGRSAGRIEGEVRITSALAARRPRFRIYSEPGVAAVPPQADAAGELANVVVYVRPLAPAPAESAPPPPPRLAMRQREERFLPHVLAIPLGTTVDFPNDDRVYHNVFSLSPARTFDLGRFPRGQSRAVRFDAPGVVKVFCHIHSDMTGVVLVLDTPHFTTPDEDGRFAVDGLPPGTYAVTAWHERIEPVQRVVEVAAGASVRLDFEIPLQDAAAGR